MTEPHIYLPSDPDDLRDGLLRGFQTHMAALAAPAVVRPPLHQDVERAALIGWRLVPATASKKGMFAGYLDAATYDLDQLAEWSETYPGCCWKVVPAGSGVWFLDVDIPGGDHLHDGVAALAGLCDRHGPLPDGPHGVSASGGRLLVFKDTGRPIAPGSGVPAPGLDTLAGRLCPMVSPSKRGGHAYRWIVAPWDVAPPAAPEWLASLVAPAALPERPRGPIKATSDTARRSFARSLDRIAAAEEGQRNATLNRQTFTAARWIAAGLLDEAEAVRALYAAGMAIGLTAAEVKGTIKSGCIAGYRQPMQVTHA